MSEESVRFDLTAVARRTLEERRPGQDLDEALLHACKELYGDRGLAAFEACTHAIQAQQSQVRLGPEEALRQLARGDTTAVVKTLSHEGPARRVTSLDELPPELREQARHMRPGETVFVERPVTGTAAPEPQPEAAEPVGKFQCAACGFSLDQPFDLCPQCGQERRRSLWRRLLGR